MNKQFWAALAIRALYTVSETALAMIPVGVGIEQVQWWHILSVSLLAGVISALKSIVTGLPEVKE